MDYSRRRAPLVYGDPQGFDFFTSVQHLRMEKSTLIKCFGQVGDLSDRTDSLYPVKQTWCHRYKKLLLAGISTRSDN